MTTLDDVPAHLLKEVEHFFAVYKDLEDKKTVVQGWEPRASAERVVEESRQRFRSDGRAP